MNKVRRVRPTYEEPEFPKWQAPQTAVGFIVGALLWLVMLLGFLFLFYVQLFGYQFRYLLSLVKPSIKPIPFWLSVIIGVFLPPFAITVIVVGALVKLLRD